MGTVSEGCHTAALDEDHDREFRTRSGIGWRPDIDEETVLVDLVTDLFTNPQTNWAELVLRQRST